MPKTIDITPSTEMLYATGRTGYKWPQAAMELLDNAEDAMRRQYSIRKKKMKVYIDPIRVSRTDQSIEKIIFADNGAGIEKSFLESGNIFKMGLSITRHSFKKATGTFGMGLKAAAQTLGNQVTIITTTTNTENLVAAKWNFQETMRSGKWVATFLQRYELTKEQVSIYKKYAGRGSGTVIIIEDISATLPTHVAFRTTLRNRVEHHYRHLLNIESGLEYSFPQDIYIGGIDSPPVAKDNDPLCVSNDRTDIIYGDKFGGFETMEYNGWKFKIRLTHTRLHKGEQRSAVPGLSGLGQFMTGVQRQGVYYIRNGRELCRGSLWKSAVISSNLFAEIAFIDSGRDDPNSPTYITTDYGKKGVVLDEKFESWINKYVIGPHVKRLSKEARDSAAKVTKGSRDQIKKTIEKTTLPSEHFNRAKRTQKEKTASQINKIFSKGKGKSGRKNSKYRGTSLDAGNSSIEIRFDEQRWPGSPYPYNVEYTAGEPIVKVILNIDFPWIRKNIYENTNATEVARNMQQIAANTLSLMYEDDDIRNSIIEKQGALLNCFDDDVGRIEKEIENIELESVIISDSDTYPQEEMVNK
jgi:hypothetical protein